MAVNEGNKCVDTRAKLCCTECRWHALKFVAAAAPAVRSCAAEKGQGALTFGGSGRTDLRLGVACCAWATRVIRRYLRLLCTPTLRSPFRSMRLCIMMGQTTGISAAAVAQVMPRMATMTRDVTTSWSDRVGSQSRIPPPPSPSPPAPPPAARSSALQVSRCRGPGREGAGKGGCGGYGGVDAQGHGHTSAFWLSCGACEHGWEGGCEVL
jgi:hypothetical protein